MDIEKARTDINRIRKELDCFYDSLRLYPPGSIPQEHDALLPIAAALAALRAACCSLTLTMRELR